MALKEAWKALFEKPESKELAKSDADAKADELTENDLKARAITVSDLFPIVEMPETDLKKYRKIPLGSTAVLGAAFSMLPASARSIYTTVTRSLPTDGPTLFVGINPKAVEGFLMENDYGTVGNIMQYNEKGQLQIAGRMRFKAVENLSVSEQTVTTVPFDPVTFAIAVAVMEINQKLDKIQESVEEVLKFLKLEKQSRQRGNLSMLSEIFTEYKRDSSNEKLLTLRNTEVQTIKREALQDILFYQEQIGAELQKQKLFHSSRDTKNLLDSVGYQFAEYQLASHIYALSTFLDVMLQKNFDSEHLNGVISDMSVMGNRYGELYTECHAQIADYQRSSIDSKLIAGAGIVTKGLGEMIAAVPVINRGQVDENLIKAGENIGRKNKASVEKRIQSITPFEDNRILNFAENIRTIDRLYNVPGSMITDGENLYVMVA